MKAACDHRARQLRARLAAGRARALLLAAALALGAGLLRGAEPPPLAEHQIESLYLFNFIKYVEWPEAAFAATNSPYTIGIVASKEIRKDLQELTQGRRINGREVLIRALERPEEARGCHILFLPADAGMRSAEVLKHLKAAPILTVGEAEDFLSQGGTVHFARQQNKLRLEINVESAREVGLTVSAKLLTVARVLKAKPAARQN